MIVKIIQELFDYKASTSSRLYGFNKKFNIEVRISSKALANYLNEEFGIPYGRKSLIVSVPIIIMKSRPEIKNAFLRGVIDGDGSILKNSIKISSGSTKFLSDMQEFLRNLGIVAGVITRDNKLYQSYSIRISNSDGLEKIKKIYECTDCYPRKKLTINNI